MECVEDGLKLSLNTGRVTTLKGHGELFGPFEAPLGFYVDGLRVKPLDEPRDGVKEGRGRERDGNRMDIG